MAATDDQPRPAQPPVFCTHGGERCFGARAAGFELCLAHLEQEQLGQVMQRLHPGADLDASRTWVDAGLLSQILGAVRDENDRPALGRVRFDGAHFTESADFAGAVFAKDASFAGARFGGYAGFDQAQFHGNAGFGLARFSAAASFYGARFDGNAGFAGTRFDGSGGQDGNISGEFSGAVFARDAEFGDARFTDGAVFDGARFERAASFGPLAAGYLGLDGAVFGQPVVIQVVAPIVSCRDVIWNAGADLRLRYAQLTLERAKFTVPSYVSGSDQPFDLPGWRGSPTKTLDEDEGFVTAVTSFYEQASEWYSRAPRSPLDLWMPRLTSLSGSDADNLALTDVDLSACDFAGARLLDQLRLEGRCVFDRPPRGLQTGVNPPPRWRRRERPADRPGQALPAWLRQVSKWLRHAFAVVLAHGVRRWSSRQSLAEERAWRATTRKYAGWSRDRKEWPAEVGPDRLAVLYRQLRKAQEDAKNEPGAADFYYGEMEMRRASATTPAGERAILWLYWLISGYGLRAARSLAALVAVGVIVTSVLVGWGLAAGTPPQDVTGTIRASKIDAAISPASPQLPPAAQRWTVPRTTTALEDTLDSIVFRATDQPLTTAGVWVTDAARVLGPVLLALALLAVRGRVKR